MSTREQFGKYLLLKKLTEDPLGETFRAGLLGDKGMERVVLLRIFNGQGIDGERLWQAMQQRQGLQQALKSPSVGDGVDMGEIEGIPYVAYDYISGKNMANLLEQAAKKRNFIPAEHALLITERIALALASANETRIGDQRVSHGFVVPHLAIISNEGETRLLGFEAGPGLRGFAANPVIRQHFGRYLAPEALAGAAHDRSDDVYSLGVVLYELLTGRPLPPPAADGYGSVIDQAVVATEGEPLEAEVATLLKQSLVARDQRIKDVAAWHKTLNTFMFEGQYNPTTFNLAFFMHNLFRQEIEKESQEIEVEKTLPVPTVQPKAQQAAPPPPPVTADPSGTGTGVHSGTGTGVGPAPDGTSPGFERTGTAISAAPEKSSKTGLIVGAIAALLLLGVGAWFFLGRGGAEPPPSEPVEQVSQPAPPPEPVVEEPAGPTEDELREQIAELVSRESKTIAETYDDQLKDLQQQLEQARREAEDRKRREAEREAAEEAAAEEARLAEEQRLAEQAAAEAAAQAEAEAQAEEEKVAAAETAKAEEKVAPPPPPPAKPQVRRGDLVEPGPGVKPPELVRRPQPRYPEMARRFNKKSATVRVRVLVDENGRVIKTEIEGEEQRFGFENEAEQAVSKSVYKPATKDGVPVKMWQTLEIEFRDR